MESYHDQSCCFCVPCLPICVLVQIIHPYLLPQNLTHEFQDIRIFELDSYEHCFVPKSNVCVIPFICKSHLLLQTLLLFLPTLHICFAIPSCPYISIFVIPLI
jgi:hypothetical protein